MKCAFASVGAATSLLLMYPAPKSFLFTLFFFNHVNSCAREAESDVVNPRVEGNRNHAGMPTGQRRQAGPGAPPGNQGVGGHGRPRQLRLVYSNIAALRFGI